MKHLKLPHGNRPLALFVSDGTGVSAETFGEALLSQFNEDFARERIPFCKTAAQAREVGAWAMKAHQEGRSIAVFSTLALPEARHALLAQYPLAIDLFDSMIAKAGSALGLSPSPRQGASHAGQDALARAARAEAVDYAHSHDDGCKTDYSEADLILVGVSRSGKTPCCMWLAMRYGLKAANYPLTADDFEPTAKWPSCLAGLESKCVGLDISAERLSQIRQSRLSNSKYASLELCRQESANARMLLSSRSVPMVDGTGKGVEEICAAIIEELDLHPARSY